jgi:nucleotide-binding universal stress UspA family protein
MPETEAEEGDPMPTPRKILVPIDFSNGSKQALAYAADLARCLPRAEIVVMHAVEPMVFSDRAARAKRDGAVAWKRKVESDLAALLRTVKAPAKVTVKPIVRSGRSYQEIARAARDVAADLIVMGSAGYTAQNYSQLGTTAERVARKAPCPVLLVREQGADLE